MRQIGQTGIVVVSHPFTGKSCSSDAVGSRKHRAVLLEPQHTPGHRRGALDLRMAFSAFKATGQAPGAPFASKSNHPRPDKPEPLKP